MQSISPFGPFKLSPVTLPLRHVHWQRVCALAASHPSWPSHTSGLVPSLSEKSSPSCCTMLWPDRCSFILCISPRRWCSGRRPEPVRAPQHRMDSAPGIPTRHPLVGRSPPRGSLGIQYPDHVRTAASNVGKSLPPPPILLENEAAAANFVGKWGHRRQFCRKMRPPPPFS